MQKYYDFFLFNFKKNYNKLYNLIYNFINNVNMVKKKYSIVSFFFVFRPN